MKIVEKSTVHEYVELLHEKIKEQELIINKIEITVRQLEKCIKEYRDLKVSQ